MDTTNQNWTYTGEQIAKFLLGIDISYDQDKKNEAKSFFRGLTAFFFTQIDDIDKCIDENDVTQVVKFYVELYTAIKSTTFDDIGEDVDLERHFEHLELSPLVKEHVKSMKDLMCKETQDALWVRLEACKNYVHLSWYL